MSSTPSLQVIWRPMVEGYRRQLDRATGRVLYFRKLPPGYLCGGPEEPFIIRAQELDWEDLPDESSSEAIARLTGCAISPAARE